MMRYEELEQEERALKQAARTEAEARMEHPALTAMRVAHQAMAAPTGDQQEWKDILENKALPMVRNAIPALEALIAERDELLSALKGLAAEVEDEHLPEPGDYFAGVAGNGARHRPHRHRQGEGGRMTTEHKALTALRPFAGVADVFDFYVEEACPEVAEYPRPDVRMDECGPSRVALMRGDYERARAAIPALEALIDRHRECEAQNAELARDARDLKTLRKVYVETVVERDELLAALEGLGDYRGTSTEAHELAIRARAAIAKAKGDA